MPKKKSGKISAADGFGAIKKNDVKKLRFILKNGFDPCRTEDESGHTGLQIATALGKPECVQCICEHLRRIRELETIATSVDEDGKTALHIAAAGGKYECAKILIFALPQHRMLDKLYKAKSSEGRTAREYAVARHNAKIVRLIDGLPEEEEVVDESQFETDEEIAARRAKFKAEKRIDVSKMSSAQLRAAGVITSDGAATKTHDETLAEASAAASSVVARWSEVATVLDSASAVDHRDRLHEIVVTREDGDDDVVYATMDAALWSCTLLNELRLRLPLLASIPRSSFARLAALNTVSITHTALTSLPDEITLLDDLKSLKLSDNKLTCLPAVPDGKLAKLEALDVRRNALTSFAAFVFPLTNLVTIYVDDNQLDSIDGLHFEKLTRLREITAASNALTELPEVIVNLKVLEVLKLQNNQIVSLPVLPKKLKECLMDGNPIKDPKLRKLCVAASRGARELKNLCKFLEKSSKKGGKGKKGKKSGSKRTRVRPTAVAPPPAPASEEEEEEDVAPAAAPAKATKAKAKKAATPVAEEAPSPAAAAPAAPAAAAASSRYGAAFDDMGSSMGIDDTLSGGQVSGDRDSAYGSYAAWGEDAGVPTEAMNEEDGFMGMSASDMVAVDELKKTQAIEAQRARVEAAKVKAKADKIEALKQKQMDHYRDSAKKGGRGRGRGRGGGGRGSGADAGFETQKSSSANKAPQGRQQGIVKMWNAQKGFGACVCVCVLSFLPVFVDLPSFPTSTSLTYLPPHYISTLRIHRRRWDGFGCLLPHVKVEPRCQGAAPEAWNNGRTWCDEGAQGIRRGRFDARRYVEEFHSNLLPVFIS